MNAAADEIERLRAALEKPRTGLRLVMVAATLLDQEDLPDEPSAILCGSIDAIRSLGGLLGDQVDVLPAGAAQPEKPPSPWRPIETAPKDGTLILALTPSPQIVRWWTDLDGYGEDYRWVGRDGCVYRVDKVRYWMPLPPAPWSDA